MREEFTHFVGIDWASMEHEVCVLDAQRKVVFKTAIANTTEAIEGLAQRLAALGPPATIAIGIETPRAAIVEILLERGFALFHLNPKQLDRFRDRHHVAGAKSDGIDARVLGDSLATDLHCFHRVHVSDSDTLQLRELVRADDELVKEQTANLHRLRDLLLRYFPQMLQLKALDEAWFWALLALVPTPAAAAKVKPARITQLLSAHRIRRLDAAQVLEVIRTTPLAVSPGTVAAVSAHVALVVPRLELVGNQRRAIEKAVKGLFKTMDATESPETAPGQKREQRDVTILLSLPGVGWKVGATLLAEAGEALAARDYSGLRALAGIAPVTKQTGGRGKVGRPEMRRAANNRLRNAHYHWARVSVQNDPKAKTQYASLRAKGHGNARALRGVADRNLRLLMGLLKARTTFDPKHGVPEVPDASP